ncbi:MAG TPA: transglutaminase [Spirochaeta sp.]|nr:transglutaminase [Spirochaeta sp.]
MEVLKVPVLNKRQIIRILIGALMICMLVLIGLKILVWNYTLDSIIPQQSYSVSVNMNFSGNGEDLVVRMFLPKSTDRQKIAEETIIAERMNFSRESTPLFDRGDWSSFNAVDDFSIKINYKAAIRPIRYEIDPSISLQQSLPENMEPFLADTPSIQVSSPEISNLARELAGSETSLLNILGSIHDYVYALGVKPFKGTTDALTAMKLEEASCNGKSRLFVALARSLGIPARLVGGIILDTGTKRTSHQWLEIYIGGYWVPFDALNGHFARLPDNYLTLYTGDEVLFRHSRNIAFDYRFDIRKRTVTNSRLTGFLGDRSLNLYNAIEGLLQSGFSMSILQFLLVIPFGVLFVVVFKNVIGLRTYGTFLPALMAMAVQETGLGPGMIAFVLVLLMTVLLRYPLEKLGLLHTPRLSIMMVGVIGILILVSSLSQLWGWQGFSALNSATLFPIAILTITSERIALTISEDGLKDSIVVLIQTLMVMTVCYLVMSSVALQALVLTFPELLLGVLALNLWIGSWTGIRVMEFYRFRALLFNRGNSGGV